MSGNVKQPPLMWDNLSYDAWKKELDIWSDFTDLVLKQQSGALFLTQKGKLHKAVLSGVDQAKIRYDEGVEEIKKGSWWIIWEGQESKWFNSIWCFY